MVRVAFRYQFDRAKNSIAPFFWERIFLETFMFLVILVKASIIRQYVQKSEWKLKKKKGWIKVMCDSDVLTKQTRPLSLFFHISDKRGTTSSLVNVLTGTDHIPLHVQVNTRSARIPAFDLVSRRFEKWLMKSHDSLDGPPSRSQQLFL